MTVYFNPPLWTWLINCTPLFYFNPIVPTSLQVSQLNRLWPFIEFSFQLRPLFPTSFLAFQLNDFSTIFTYFVPGFCFQKTRWVMDPHFGFYVDFISLFYLHYKPFDRIFYFGKYQYRMFSSLFRNDSKMEDILYHVHRMISTIWFISDHITVCNRKVYGSYGHPVKNSELFELDRLSKIIFQSRHLVITIIHGETTFYAMLFDST